MSGPPPPPPHGPGNDDDDLGPGVIACAVVCLAISTAAVAARFYTRSVIVRAVAAEDWFALAALILAYGSTAGTIWQAMAGKGRHWWVLGPEDYMNHGKASWMGTLFYQLCLACCKISILLLYIRVLTYTYARRAAYLLLAIVIIYNTFGFISTFTLCIPLAKYWDPNIDGHCHAGPEYMWAVICLHIITDFLIFLIPMPVVLGMTTSWGNKVMLVLVFAMGFFVCLISILRAVWIKNIPFTQDILWDTVSITNWTTIEVCTSIVCTSLIVLRPLGNKLWQAIVPSRWRRSSGGRDGAAGNGPSASSDNSSTDGRPPTIGTRPTGFGQFGDGLNPMSGGVGVLGGNQSSAGSGNGSWDKEGSGIEEAMVADQYAAAVREVSMPSPGLAKTKESFSEC